MLIWDRALGEIVITKGKVDTRAAVPKRPKMAGFETFEPSMITDRSWPGAVGSDGSRIAAVRRTSIFPATGLGENCGSRLPARN